MSEPDPSDEKRFATLRARLALAGWALVHSGPKGATPIYFAVRWNMARTLPDLAAVEAFADQVGAPR